jgi:hypothetical protein
MATVINNPNADSSQGGWAVAIIVLAIIVLGVLAFFAFGQPSFTGESSGGTEVNIPVTVGGGDEGAGAGAY